MSPASSQPLIWRVGAAGAPQRPASLLQSQMRLAAQFAASASHDEDLQALQHEICRIAAEGLKVAFVKLLVYDADTRMFAVKAGVGWRDGVVGETWLDADVGTAAGFAWQSGESIISNDLSAEARFRVPAVLAEHGIIRSINVVVAGDAEAAFGVLEAESPEPGTFAEHDVFFLQILAQSLAAAVGRSALRDQHDQQAARSTGDHQTSLRELQHRIRNDLQVIWSLVRREQRRTADLEALIGFARVGRQVMAVGDLYDHLLGHGETGDVDMGSYLRSLCGKIANAGDLPSRGIALNVDTQRLMLPRGHAVGLAVVVNELVTNAVEHAFPDGAPGAITVSLIASGEDGTGSSMVSVSDDGCGFSGPLPGSTGLTFVKELTRQAGGLLELENGAGTRWTIRLPARSPN